MAVVLVLVVLAGCAKPEPVKTEQWVLDKPQMLQELARTKFKVLELEQQIEVLNESLAESKMLARRQQQDLDAMMASFRVINKTVKHDRTVARKEIQALKKDATHQANVTQTQSADSQQNLSQANEKTSAARTSVVNENPNERNAYSAAYLAFKSDRFIEASALFDAFIKNYPAGEYTGQAKYWLGESLLAEKRYQEAELILKGLTSSDLESGKRSAALLDLAKVQMLLNKTAEAKETLKNLVEAYPESLAASQAKEQFKQMNSPVAPAPSTTAPSTSTPAPASTQPVNR